MGEVVSLNSVGDFQKKRQPKKNNKDASILELPLVDLEKAAEIDPHQIAKEVLLKRLSNAPRTRKELAQDLKNKRIEESIAQDALNRFEELGLINDQAFSENFVQNYHARKKLGKNALRQQLRAKGVSEEIAQEAVAQISQSQEFQAALSLACKKIRSIQSDDPQAQLRKIVGLLARKGYSSNLSFQVAREVVNEIPEGLFSEN